MKHLANKSSHLLRNKHNYLAATQLFSLHLTVGAGEKQPPLKQIFEKGGVLCMFFLLKARGELATSASSPPLDTPLTMLVRCARTQHYCTCYPHPVKQATDFALHDLSFRMNKRIAIFPFLSFLMLFNRSKQSYKCN